MSPTLFCSVSNFCAATNSLLCPRMERCGTKPRQRDNKRAWMAPLFTAMNACSCKVDSQVWQGCACPSLSDLASSQPCTTATSPHLITQVRGVASRTAIHYQNAGRDSTFNLQRKVNTFNRVEAPTDKAKRALLKRRWL